MRKFIILGAALGALAACGQSSDEAAVKEGANEAQPKPKPAYCFFKDDELKSWTATRDKRGNITLEGKAHVKDPRYKAQFGPAEVAAGKAVIAPTISQNDGYASPDNWWEVSATIPNSAAVASVEVQCGGKSVAKLDVAPAK